LVVRRPYRKPWQSSEAAGPVEVVIADEGDAARSTSCG
jgi:hypothetical protein